MSDPIMRRVVVVVVDVGCGRDALLVVPSMLTRRVTTFRTEDAVVDNMMLLLLEGKDDSYKQTQTLTE
jgi:hypothetical protein